MGWIPNARPGNPGGVGNTLEDLLGIEENNLPIPNAAEWELKTKRIDSNSLTTLMHIEPSPRAMKFVPAVFLPNYGWEHKLAGKKYPSTERSFRQTINAKSRTDRGFGIFVNWEQQKLEVSFDANAVDTRHSVWISDVEQRVGLERLNPQPYWGFEDLYHKARTKWSNCFFVLADVEKRAGKEFFCYSKILMLQRFTLERLLRAIENGFILVDFDARTGHNHGTKFRLRSKKTLINDLRSLFEVVKEIS